MMMSCGEICEQICRRRRHCTQLDAADSVTVLVLRTEVSRLTVMPKKKTFGRNALQCFVILMMNSGESRKQRGDGASQLAQSSIRYHFAWCGFHHLE